LEIVHAFAMVIALRMDALFPNGGSINFNFWNKEGEPLQLINGTKYKCNHRVEENPVR